MEYHEAGSEYHEAAKDHLEYFDQKVAASQRRKAISQKRAAATSGQGLPPDAAAPAAPAALAAAPVAPAAGAPAAPAQVDAWAPVPVAPTAAALAPSVPAQAQAQAQAAPSWSDEVNTTADTPFPGYTNAPPVVAEDAPFAGGYYADRENDAGPPTRWEPSMSSGTTYKAPSTSVKSSYVGVSWHQPTASWKASITAGKRVRWDKYDHNTQQLGSFQSEEDAARAYDDA